MCGGLCPPRPFWAVLPAPRFCRVAFACGGRGADGWAGGSPPPPLAFAPAGAGDALLSRVAFVLGGRPPQAPPCFCPPTHPFCQSRSAPTYRRTQRPFCCDLWRRGAKGLAVLATGDAGRVRRGCLSTPIPFIAKQLFCRVSGNCSAGKLPPAAAGQTAKPSKRETAVATRGAVGNQPPSSQGGSKTPERGQERRRVLSGSKGDSERTRAGWRRLRMATSSSTPSAACSRSSIARARDLPSRQP